MQALKTQLIEAYSPENLNHITAKILLLYKQKQHHAIKQIYKIVNDFYDFPYENNARLYSKLILLYHPDKQQEYHQNIKKITNKEQFDFYAHIFPVLQFVKNDILMDVPFKTPEEFEQEYGWNYQPVDDDYFFLRDNDETISYFFDEENPEDNAFFTREELLGDGSFLAALKRKIYGARYIDFPTYLLEDLEEIEMAEYDIEQLDGIEFCTYAKIVDLSYNQLFDIGNLEHCVYIQELYLANNQISQIDALYHLPDLRVLDLAQNQVVDILVLLQLKNLEFVNLLGNPVSKLQINALKNAGVTVVV